MCGGEGEGWRTKGVEFYASRLLACLFACKRETIKS